MSAHHTDYAAMGLPTGLGENAFTDTRISSVFATKHAVATAKRSGQQSTLITNLRRAGVKVGVLRGLSQKGDELARQSREREEAITALKPLNGFNAPIATPEQGLRTHAIKGKL